MTTKKMREFLRVEYEDMRMPDREELWKKTSRDLEARECLKRFKQNARDNLGSFPPA